MQFDDGEVQWRDTLRTSRKLKTAPIINCEKLQRYSLKASILCDNEGRNSAIISKTPSHQKELTIKNKHIIAQNCSDFAKSHKELLHHYEEIIKKQIQEISQISSENSALERKILKFKSTETEPQFMKTEVEEFTETDDKMIEFYKSAIKSAENLMKRQKNEFQLKISQLKKEREKLEEVANTSKSRLA